MREVDLGDLHVEPQIGDADDEVFEHIRIEGSDVVVRLDAENRQDWPYIFDAEHERKLAYEAIVDF